jgi:hypothetical protein
LNLSGCPRLKALRVVKDLRSAGVRVSF